MGTFDYFSRKPFSVGVGGGDTYIYYNDPVEIINIDDDEYDIIEAD